MHRGRRLHSAQPGSAQLIEQVDKLAATGRLSEDQTAQLRAAAERGELAVVMREVRLQHVRLALADAVAVGTLGQPDADALLARLEHGEDTHALRRELRRAGILPAARRGDGSADA
jgi:hypothetical protein